MFLHELPTTGEVVFSDFLLASSSNLTTELAHATELRARIRALLKANRRDDATHSTRDWIKIVKAADEYLPHLFAIHNCLQTDDIILKYEPEFSWRTCFSASIIGPPPRIAIRGIQYELLSVLLLSGCSLSNLATSIIAALGPAYERDRMLTDAERKAKDDKLKTAADLLCRAAGIFEYIASSLVPAWENAAGRIDPRPPETTAELARALSKLALADAQALAIRKLLSPSVALAEDTITPGPPLPRTHPSASLLAKLHLETCALYESAEPLARLSGSKRAAAAGGHIALGASASGRVGGSGGGLAVEPPPAVVAARQAGYDLQAVPRGGGLGPSANAYAYEGSDGGSSSNQGPPPNQQYASGGGGKPSRLLNFASRLGGKGGGGGGGGSGSGIPGPRPGSSDAPPSSSGSSSYSHPGVTPTLLNYLSTNALFARAQAYRWLGVDSGEQRSAYGEALAYLALAREELEDGDSPTSSSGKHSSSTDGSSSSGPKKRSKLAQKLADISASASASASSGSKRNKELRAELKAKSQLELRDVAHWTRAYAKLNDTITFYPVPPAQDVLAKIPAGRAALSLKTFVPPAPAFGPGSSGEFLSDGMRRLGFGHTEDSLDVLVRAEGDGAALVEHDGTAPPEGSLLGTERSGTQKASYAGAGAYY